MLIRFSRPKGKPVLTCVRDDGSMTYTKPRQGEFFARHDLMHYAVEKTLGLKQSFFGMIAAGRSVEQTGIAAELPEEAKLTELFVGHLMQETAFGTPSTAAEFNGTIAAALKNGRRGSAEDVRVLSDDELGRIRELFARLIGQYVALGNGGRMELQFP